MSALTIAVLVVAGFLVLGMAAAWSYGRFARRSRGEPAYSLPVSPAGTALDRLFAPVLDERPGASGLILIEENLEAFAVRALTARTAGRSLDLQYYIWDADLTGRLLAYEVLAAADRGVRVRILIDDINGQYHDRAYLALMRHPLIDVRVFNPIRARGNSLLRGLAILVQARRSNRRMHNKAWIADGRIAVVGGRNIGDAYFDAAEVSNFTDIDIALLGPAVAETEAVFDRFWNSAAAIPIGNLGRWRKGELGRLRKALDRFRRSEAAIPYLDRVAADRSVRDMVMGRTHVYWTPEVKVLTDPPEKAVGEGEDGWLLNFVRPALATATTRLRIISPYFVPGAAGTEEFLAMVRRGIEVEVLTNSLAATDVAAVHGAYSRYREVLVRGGVRLYELKQYTGGKDRMSLLGSSAASLHTKAFTIDGRTGFVGSMNFDPRSASLNTEMGVLFSAPGLVADVDRLFEAQCQPASAYRIAIDGNGMLWDDGSASPPRDEPDTSWARRALTRVIGWLPVEPLL